MNQKVIKTQVQVGPKSLPRHDPRNLSPAAAWRYWRSIKSLRRAPQRMRSGMACELFLMSALGRVQLFQRLGGTHGLAADGCLLSWKRERINIRTNFLHLLTLIFVCSTFPAFCCLGSKPWKAHFQLFPHLSGMTGPITRHWPKVFVSVLRDTWYTTISEGLIFQNLLNWWKWGCTCFLLDLAVGNMQNDTVSAAWLRTSSSNGSASHAFSTTAALTVSFREVHVHTRNHNTSNPYSITLLYSPQDLTNPFVKVNQWALSSQKYIF